MNSSLKQEAWQAYERKDYEVAAELYKQLIMSCSSESEIDSYKHSYGYVLVALGDFDKARTIYQQLYEKSKSHIFIHQLGMVEREAGEYQKAATLFQQEYSMLKPIDGLSIAANLYEQALIEKLIGNQDSSLELAKRCLVESLETSDSIMHGCAYRLLGDLLFHDCREKANVFYDKARKAFSEAGDTIACSEIDERQRKNT